MAQQHTAVVGVYSSVPEADRAVYQLLQRASFIVEVSVKSAGAGATLLHPWLNVRLARGASGGSVAGAAAGATLGWLAGAGLIKVPLLAAFVTAGPVLATLAGTVAGAMIGSLIGALTGVVRAGGDPETPVEQSGSPQSIMLAVHCDSTEDIERARSLLKETGAADIEEQPEATDGRRPVLP